MTIRGPLFWLSCVAVVVYADLTLDVQYAWRFLEYQYDSTWEKNDAIQSGVYYFRKNYPFDVEVAPDGRMFVTVRREFGVPSSLNTIVTNVVGEGGGPLLTAYPNWSWAKRDSCDNIIGAYRMVQDECNRLWVLDNGKFGDDVICPPKLLAFDLTTDKLVQRLDIPENLTRNAHGLETPIIDTVGPNCSETDIYMADSQGGILIWNGNTTWRVESPFFEPSPGGETFSVFGIDFTLSRGIVGIAITREVPVMERLLYFRPLSSFDMHHVRAVDLHRNRNKPEAIEYLTEETKLPSQSVAQAFSSQGILFFTSVSDYNLLCWNRHKPFIPENIVEISKDHKTMRWASGIKIYQRDDRETLWVLTNRLPEIETGKINFTRTNFRVLTGDVKKLVSGTNCELQGERIS